jgi:hypothetical protein
MSGAREQARKSNTRNSVDYASTRLLFATIVR